jgi:hypothetical protein
MLALTQTIVVVIRISAQHAPIVARRSVWSPSRLAQDASSARSSPRQSLPLTACR